MSPEGHVLFFILLINNSNYNYRNENLTAEGELLRSDCTKLDFFFVRTVLTKLTKNK